MDSPTIAVPERYRILGVLGSGGMSHVYRAHDSILDKTVAIKILQIESGYGRDEHVRRFQLEARATATLKHDNIVSILDFGLTEDSVPYMVLDHLEGKSLKEIIEGSGPLRLERALPVSLQVCAGLEHAHKNGIVHRDLKPSNIIFAVDQNGNEVIKVIDFGIARLEENGSLTATNAVIGSPPYMSPEQATGKKIGVTSDLYSLGCVIFESLTGRPPFVGNTSVETIMMHVNNVPPKLSDVADDDFPPALENLIAKLLQKEPSNRYQSMEQVIAALKEIDPRTATGIAAPQTETKKGTEFAKGLLIAVLALGLIIGAVAGIIMLLDVYTNEVEKPPVTGNPVTLSHSDPFKEYCPTLTLDRNDASLKKAYKDDTRTKRMELSGCDVTDKGIGYIKHLPLELLDVRFCSGVTDRSLPMIGEIRTLQFLRLDNFTHNATKDESSFSSFANLVRLEHLTVDGVRLTQKDFEALSKIPNLRSVHFNRVPDVTKENLLALRNMPKLAVIELGSEHHPTDIYSALAQIRSLETVGLNSTKLTDEELPALVQVKQLTSVMLQRTLITDDGLMYLAKNLPHMRELNLTLCPNVTLKGKKAFQKARPKVNVIASSDSKNPGE